MKLSIYVNLRSIGWVVTDATNVVAKGIKRVNTDFDTYYEYVGGGDVSKRINRRQKRQARRNLWRYNQRRVNLKKYLKEKGWNNDKIYTDKEIYSLRVKALSKKVTDSELGAIFLSLQKKRGYKSLRGVKEGDERDYFKEIKYHEEKLKGYKSIADYLLTTDTAKGIIFMREYYESEFDKICQTQGINDKKLRDLLYFQRPLKRGKIANCPLEKNNKVCHYSHPTFQKFRILRDVNNINILDLELNEIEIPFEIRQKWTERLMSGSNLTKTQCCKDLGIKKATGYSWKSGKAIIGNVVINALGTDNVDLWQDVFSATDDQRLLLLLKKKYPNVNENIIETDLNSLGWGDYSHKAITKLLPFLEKGLTLRESILEVYGIVDLKADVALRNLVLEQHYDSYTSLLKKVKQKYDITEIAIEISHLLKASKKGRKEMARRKRQEAKEGGDSYINHLKRLLKETNYRSPYEPDVVIDENSLDAYNIDHIIPKSKIFEFGAINQCICRKTLNEKKGTKTGIEFAKELGIEDQYVKFINNLKLSEQKKWFFMAKTDNIPDKYIKIEDYNTKCFLRSADYVIPNRIINKYLKDWNLDVYKDNDVRNSLMRALVIANFNSESIDYFNSLHKMGSESIGRYVIEQQIFTDADVIPYIPRIKYYRKNKGCITPQHSLHDESVLGRRVEQIRMPNGTIKEKEYFKIRKPITSLTLPMVERVMGGMREKIKERIDGRNFEDVKTELIEKPIVFNGKPVNSVSVRINANELIQLNRGFCYSSFNHRLDLKTNKVVKYFDYIKDLNEGKSFEGKYIKKNDVVEYNGQYYFIVGALYPPDLRSVFELDAVSLRGSKSVYENMKIVRVNELGELKYDFAVKDIKKKEQLTLNLEQ